MTKTLRRRLLLWSCGSQWSQTAVEIRAAKGAGGGFDAGQVDLAAFAAFGVKADDAASVTEGHPEFVQVDGHSVEGLA